MNCGVIISCKWLSPTISLLLKYLFPTQEFQVSPACTWLLKDRNTHLLVCELFTARTATKCPQHLGQQPNYSMTLHEEPPQKKKTKKHKKSRNFIKTSWDIMTFLYPFTSQKVTTEVPRHFSLAIQGTIETTRTPLKAPARKPQRLFSPWRIPMGPW